MIVRPALGAVAFVMLTAGCAANPTVAQPAPSPSLSYNTVPTHPTFPSPSESVPSAPTARPTTTPPSIPIDRRPSGPPNGPTDNLKKTSWVVGTISRGGTGPCYGLETDDGVQYALYSTAGTNLTKGTRMRINTRAAKVKIFCGDGKLLEMTAAEPLR